MDNAKTIKEVIEQLPERYFPIEFSSYEDYVKYLKEKGFAVEVIKDNNSYKDQRYDNRRKRIAAIYRFVQQNTL